MLKQIKNLGLSLVIGSMLVASIPVFNNSNCYAAVSLDGMKEEDRVVEMYKYHCEDIYGYECTDKEEAMVRKYFKYRTIKSLAVENANEYYNEKMYQSNVNYLDANYAQYTIGAISRDLEELFPNIENMSEEQQRVLEFVYGYKFNRQLNLKNTISYCTECKTNYVKDKYGEMLRGENKCYKHYENIPLSKLTGTGLKAALIRTYEYKASEITSVVENEDTITITIEYVNGMTYKTEVTTFVYDRNTRTEISCTTIEK